MPKENKNSRGRRDQEKLKRKRDRGDVIDDQTSKRPKSRAAIDNVVFSGTDNTAKGTEHEDRSTEEEGRSGDRPFYGILEDEEQEYFRRADEMLELNDFPSNEDRKLFLTSVYKEAEGKELKIACSQSCSRLMERLILLSTNEQKKTLFRKFSDNFAHLVQHRFASHCCEALFIESAPIVTEELISDSGIAKIDDDEIYVSMENLFLYTLNELEGQMTFLLTNTHASHALRILLIILSGRSLQKGSTKSLLQSKRKEGVSVAGYSSSQNEMTLSKRAVPDSFTFAVEKILSDTIATMDLSFIRVLATHPTGNPTLQLLLELELSNPNTKKGANSSERSILSSLLPDDITQEGSESAVFVNGIIYDKIGSRLLETIMTFAPGKQFKQIYRTVFKERIAALARNEIACYVVIKVLNRVSKEDLEDAVAQIHPQVPGFVERKRITVLKTLLERCNARGADSKVLVDAIATSYGLDPKDLVLNMIGIDDISTLVSSTTTPILQSAPGEAEQSEEVTKTQQPNLPAKPIPSQIHGSLLAQSMLSLPTPASELVQASLLALPQTNLLALSLWTTTSHLIQSALSTSLPIHFRRKFINVLLFISSQDLQQSPILLLALSPIGSHVLDSLLTCTTAPLSNSTSTPLFTFTERIALSLATYESQLRDSWTGRIVWRNWSMDLFKRRRGDWVRKVKEAGAVSSDSSVPSVLLDPGTGEEAPMSKGRKTKRGNKGEVQERKSLQSNSRERNLRRKGLKQRQVSKGVKIRSEVESRKQAQMMSRSLLDRFLSLH